MEKFSNKTQARRYAKDIWSKFLKHDSLKHLHDHLYQFLYGQRNTLQRCLVSYPLSDEYPIIDKLIDWKLLDDIYLPVIVNSDHYEMTFRKISLVQLMVQKNDYSTSLVKSSLGFYEPTSNCPEFKLPFSFSKDIMFIPALALNQERSRLGRGKGYYDRFYQKMQLSASEFAMRVCLLPKALEYLDFPAQQHDLQIDVVITENGIQRVST